MSIRNLIAPLLALCIAGCSGTQGDIQTAIDRTVLGSVIGRSYASATAAMPALPFAPTPEPPYGRLFSTSLLPDGTRLHRHLIRDIGQRSRVSILGITQSDTQQFSYRLMYFRVDPAGVVTDTANGFWLGESQRCVGYFGNIFRTCEDAQQLSADVAFFDSLVKTSSGQPIESWGRPR
jgi:hypothetical protein